MANPPRQLAPPPDNTQILSFIRVEYARRVAPEDAYRNIGVVIQHMRERPNEVLELAREQQQQLAPEQAAPAPEAPRAEEPKQDDSEKVEPGKELESPRVLKRAKHSPINPSESKRTKHMEHDPQEGTSSSQFCPPHPPPPPESAAPVPMDIEDPADISDPDIYAGDETMELVEQALQQPPINREEAKAQEEARKSEEPPSGDDDRFRSPPLAKELARAEDVIRPDTSPEKPKTPEHDPGYWLDALRRIQQEVQERQCDDGRNSSVDSEDYPDSDIDSDDYEDDELDDLDDTDVIPDEYIIPFDDFTLDFVKETYRILANREFKAIIQFPLGAAEDISRILHIRRFTRINLLHLPIDSVEVTIGWRYIIFDIRHAPTGTYNTIQYVSHRDGCRFEHNNISMLVRGVKYQTLAAKDFFYLVRHPNSYLKKLIIGIVNYDNPRLYPFQSFFWKLSNYFESSDSLKLSVSEFVITTFYENNDGDRARDFIEIFWSKLTPKVLKSAIFRVWDDEHVRHRLQLDVPPDRNLTRNLYHNEQWKHLKELDILDENIVINPAEYTHFTHLDKTRVFLPTSDIDYFHFKEIAVKPNESILCLPNGYVMSFTGLWRRGNVKMNLIIIKYLSLSEVFMRNYDIRRVPYEPEVFDMIDRSPQPNRPSPPHHPRFTQSPEEPVYQTVHIERDLSTMPIELLKFFCKYEYFKKEGAKTCRMNIESFFDSGKYMHAVDLFTDYFVSQVRDWFNGDKQQSMYSHDPDPDSDQETEIQYDDSKIILSEFINEWFPIYAKAELKFTLPKRKLRINCFMNILPIRAATPNEKYSALYSLEASTIHVTIAPRTIFINFGMEETYTMTSVQYWSHEEGCLFRWGNNVRLIKGVKYQQLAARQFYALVENPNTKIKTLRFSVKEFDAKHDPAQWPFRSFHREVQKLLARIPGIQVENFDMTFHSYSGSAVEGEKILKSVLPYLDPETLIKIKLRVWDDHEILRMKDMSSFYKYFMIPDRLKTLEAHFRSAKEIDILDPYITVVKFDLLWLHNTVNCMLSTEDFIPLVKCCPVDQVKPGMCMEFLLDERFDIEEAEKELRSSGLARSGRDLRIGNGKINVVFSKKNERKRVEFIAVN
ncbi:hypothetical protein CAEBREN_04390 [Caenorhabditis brenneri]|uniref:DUF38 domain-containing protein n=1 Tax=Caenorhabditis brenneri TaxID=135651 RepID=G0MQY4_CAEBE|nr:hypothetical protein CAEBREN_04390 [Caenorhabditis brenneri]